MLRPTGRRGLRAVAAAAAGVALALSACGAGNGEPSSTTSGDAVGGDKDASSISGTVSLLTPIFEGSEGQVVLEQELLPKFYEEYPDVTVEIDYTTYGQLNEKLTTAVASGLVPDIMMMGVGWIEGFAERGVLKDLNEAGYSIDELEKDFTPQILEAGVYKDGIYGLPIMLDTRFGVARMDILAEAGYDAPPSNWDEMREMAIALTERADNGEMQRAGFDMLSIDPRQMFLTLFFSNGGSLFNDDLTEPTFNSPEGVDALEYLVQLMRDDKVEEPGWSSTSQEVHPLLNDRAAMTVGHNNLWIQAEEAAPETLEHLEPFLLNKEQPGMFFGGTFATMSSNSQNPEAAEALFEFLLRPEVALAASEQRGNVPAHKELLESDYVQNNPFVLFAMENLEHAQREGGPAAWLEIRGDFRPAIEAALLGQKTAQQALDDLAADAQTAMNR